MNYAGIPDEYAQLDSSKIVIIPVMMEQVPGLKGQIKDLKPF